MLGNLYTGISSSRGSLPHAGKPTYIPSVVPVRRARIVLHQRPEWLLYSLHLLLLLLAAACGLAPPTFVPVEPPAVFMRAPLLHRLACGLVRTVLSLPDVRELSHHLDELVHACSMTLTPGRSRAPSCASWGCAHCGQRLQYWLARATSSKQSSSRQRLPPPCAMQ